MASPYVARIFSFTISLNPKPQIVPLLSQTNRPLPADLDEEGIKALTKRVQFGGDEVVEAKAGTGSATLSMAYAGAEFAFKILRALAGETGIVAPSYVNLDANVGGKEIQAGLGVEVPYFAAPVTIGVGVFVSWLK